MYNFFDVKNSISSTRAMAIFHCYRKQTISIRNISWVTTSDQKDDSTQQANYSFTEKVIPANDILNSILWCLGLSFLKSFNLKWNNSETPICSSNIPEDRKVTTILSSEPNLKMSSKLQRVLPLYHQFIENSVSESLKVHSRWNVVVARYILFQRNQRSEIWTKCFNLFKIHSRLLWYVISITIANFTFQI